MSNSETPSSSPFRQLPDRPSMEQLKKQAKELLHSVRAADANALNEVRVCERDPDLEDFKLTDAQRILARGYGFLSWRQLKRKVDSLDIREFCIAVTKSDLLRVRELVELRPELVDLDRGDEQIALHIPVLAQDKKMTQLLMELGSNARRGFWPHREVTSAYSIAKDRGYTEVMRIIEKEEAKRTDASPPEVANKTESSEREKLNGQNIAESITAVAAGNIAAVRELHQSGGLVNKIDFYSGGLLSIAVRQDDFEMLKLLVDYDLDVDERISEPVGNGYNHSCGMPLYNTATHGRTEMASWLIAHGCDVNAVVHGCGDALSNANEEMRKLLLDSGARVTVEHVAGWRDLELAKTIIDGTAPAQSLNSSATQAGDGTANPEIISCFIWTAAYHGVPEIVERCLNVIDWPVDESSWHYVLIQPFRFGNTACADRSDESRQNFYDCLKLLLDHGVDPDAKMNGNTALQHLASSGEPTEPERLEFAKILLEAGASLTVRDTGTMKSSPLGWACRWGRMELVQFLLERGAIVEEPGAEKWATPIARANSKGHQQIVELLQNNTTR